MKKVKWLLAAAVVATVAACQSDAVLRDVVSPPTDSPKAIGFSSYSEKSTRGDVNDASCLEYYHSTFAVYGTKQSNNDATDIQYVFGAAPVINTVDATAAELNPAGTTCTYQATADAVLGDWKYTDPRYWDKQATYDFIAYAPVSDKNPIRYYYKNAEGVQVGDAGNEFKTTSTYTLEGTNLQATATEAEKVKGFTAEAGKDLDLMIAGVNSQQNWVAASNAYQVHDDYVTFLFRHILAKLNVTFSKSAVLQSSTVTIKEVTITGLDDSGDYVESHYVYTPTVTTSGWTPSSDDANYQLQYKTTDGQSLNGGTYSDDDNNPATPAVFHKGKPYYFIESLVMPQSIDAADQVTLTAKYTITGESGYSENYTYKLDLYDVASLHKFIDGFNYTLNFTIDPDVIKFNADVSVWDSSTNINKDIN